MIQWLPDIDQLGDRHESFTVMQLFTNGSVEGKSGRGTFPGSAERSWKEGIYEWRMCVVVVARR